MLRIVPLLAALPWLAFSLLAVVRAPTHATWQLSVLATEYGHLLAPAGLLLLPAWRRGRAGRAATIAGWIGCALLLSPLLRAMPLLREAAAAGAPEAEPFRLLPGGIERIEPRRFTYATRGDTRLVLDFYAPPDPPEDPAPLVIVIHGGSWAGGDPTQLPRLNSVLARTGHAVASISYRLAPRAHHPAQVEDVRAALEWLRSQATELRLDPSRVVLLGRSAGGHLALLTAYTANDPGIRGVISFYAPTDLVWGWEHPASPRVIDSRGALAGLIGATPAYARATFVEASPITHVANAPATLLFHGTRDELVSVENMRRLAAALEARGRDVRAIEMPWATHGCDYGLRGPCGNLTTHATLAFLDAAFRAPASVLH